MTQADSLHVFGSTHAGVVFDGVKGEPGLEVHRLAVDLKFNPDPHLQNTHIFLGGDLRLGATSESPLYVGRVSSTRPAVYMAFADGRSATPELSLATTLSPGQLEAIESRRRTGDVALTLDLQGFALVDAERLEELRLERPVVEMFGQLRFIVTAGEWERVLQAMRWAAHVSVQVRFADLPRAARSEFDALVDGLRTKPPQDVVRDARVFIERHLQGPIPRERQIRLPEKHSADKDLRFAWVQQALKTVTDVAAHGDETAAAIEWTREDALSVVALIAALLHRQ